MSFSEWQKNGWLKRHAPDRSEIARKLEVIDRDLRVSGNAEGDGDWRFVAAYNAALQAATIALLASGYEAAKGGGAHFYTIESLKLSIGDDGVLTDALQAFRAKRGGSIYETVGIASESEIQELRGLAIELRDRVLEWMQQHHAGLL